MKIIGRLLILLCLQLTFADISIMSRVDRKTISMGETVFLTLEIRSDRNINLPQFNLPELHDFNVVGSSRSYKRTNVNGKVTNVLESRFELVPKKIGQLKIPALAMKIKRQNLSTKPILISVRKSISIENSDRKGSKQINYPDVFVESIVNKQTYYLGEPIVYTVKFYTRMSFFRGPSLQESTVMNLKKAEGVGDQSSNYSKELGGKRYNVSELKAVYFAEEEGKSNFGRSGIVYSFSPFERNKQVYSKDIALNIKKIPDSDPYNYAVGMFKIKTSVDKPRVYVNDGIYLRIVIEGVGNLREATISDLDFGSDLEQFDPKIELVEALISDGLHSKKTFEYLLIPRTSGIFDVPEIAFTYFDPASKRFKISSSDKIKLIVNKAQTGRISRVIYDDSLQQEVHKENEDIKYIKEKQGPIFNLMGQRVKLIVFLIALIVLIWTVIGNLLVFVFLRLFVSGPDRLFFRKIKGIKREPAIFYDRMYTALIEYIAGKKRLRSGEINSASIRTILNGSKKALDTIKYFEQRKYMPRQDYDKHDIEVDFKKALSCFKDIKKEVK